MGLSYFKIFVAVLFPIPAFLLLGLLSPLPKSFRRMVLKSCDMVLFLRPHPMLPFNLYWCCLFLSVVTMYTSYLSMNKARGLYEDVKERGGNKDSPLVSLMAAERNLWVSGGAVVLWVLLQRIRDIMMNVRRLENRLENSKED